MMQRREQGRAKIGEGVIRSGCVTFGAAFAVHNFTDNALFSESALPLFAMPECAFALFGLFYAVLYFCHSSDTLRGTP